MNKKKEVKKDPVLAIDMMHYKTNRLSFWLIILTIVLNVVMFIIIYKTTACTSNLQLGIDLLINVIFMLACFLAAEQTKRYSKRWGIVSIVIGVLQIVRIFWIPLYYFNQGGLPVGKFVACVILIALGGISLIFAGVICIKKFLVLDKHKPLLEIEGAKKDVRT